MEISNIEPLEINRITDLIPERTLTLLLRGLGELGATLVVEEKDKDGIITRVPAPKESLTKYWTPLCEYHNHFKSGKQECIDDTKRRSREIIDNNITEPQVVYCHLGLSVVAIPFVFKDRVIGVLFGGKKRQKEGEIDKRLDEFVEKHPSILEEKAIWDGEEEEKEWKDKRFSLFEVKGSIDKIPEINQEEFQKEIERLKESADYVIKVGFDNYYAQSRLKNQQFVFEMMEYFVKNYSEGKTPLKDILQPIVKEITLFAKARCAVFIWKKECTITHFCEKWGIIECPSPGETIEEIKDLIKTKFKKKNEIYYFLKEDLKNDEVSKKIESLLKIIPDYSIYAKSVILRDGSDGFFILVDAAGKKKNFDDDCCEFLDLVTERIKSQIDIYLTDEARSEFMTEMTHRLKQPMQYIMDENGYLEERLKEKYPDDSEAQSAFQGITDGVAHLNHQIRNYYYLTTMSTGGWEYDFQSHPMATLVRKCVRRFQPSAKNRGIRIFTNIAEGIGIIEKRTEFDWDTMDIVISNLLDNAVKYSHFNRDIFVDLYFDDKKEICSLTVADRGLGIDRDEYDKIFEKYYRGKNMKDPIRWIPGTGVGLSVVDRIIHSHNGWREVESKILMEKQKGDVYHTIFKIFLPYKQQKGGER